MRYPTRLLCYILFCNHMLLELYWNAEQTMILSVYLKHLKLSCKGDHRWRSILFINWSWTMELHDQLTRLVLLTSSGGARLHFDCISCSSFFKSCSFGKKIRNRLEESLKNSHNNSFYEKETAALHTFFSRSVIMKYVPLRAFDFVYK